MASAGGRIRPEPLTTRQYARLVSTWIAGIGLDASFYGTHSLRRTPANLDPQQMRIGIIRNARIRRDRTRNLVNAAVAAGVGRIVA